ncbi:MAG: 50S ribosomal protein L1 [Patescibacteria group bacterium]|jgi:large subunit ribosomal protein L1|nr:50S ribosomal protein L1 [Patescibacteria group bacterium]MDD5173047.1 50S ribosomal protein L1 [Patescibacteria group bacterium]
MRSKKYQEFKNKIKKELYALDEAIEFIKENSSSKFDQTLEIHVHLGIDPKKTEQQVRGMLVFPSGAVKRKRIAVFVGAGKEKEAKEAGADIIGGKELIEKIKNTSKCDFDIAVAEPEMMKELSSIARILGPKGLMPNPKTDTVTTEIAKTVLDLQQGKISFKSDAGGNIHQAVAKVSWPTEKIKENIETFLNVIKKSKPAGVKGLFIKNTVLSATMGPGLKIQI